MKLKPTLRKAALGSALTGVGFLGFMSFESVKAWGTMDDAAAHEAAATAVWLFGSGSEESDDLVRHHRQEARKHLDAANDRMPGQEYGQAALACFGLSYGIHRLNQRLFSNVVTAPGPEITPVTPPVTADRYSGLAVGALEQELDAVRAAVIASEADPGPKIVVMPAPAPTEAA